MITLKLKVPDVYGPVLLYTGQVPYSFVSGYKFTQITNKARIWTLSILCVNIKKDTYTLAIEEHTPPWIQITEYT